MVSDKNSFALFRTGGFAELEAFWKRLNRAEEAAEVLADNPLPFVEDAIDRIQEKIASFEPAVSVIGQVKAGKSTLLNALIGETDLLPSDVNPWTSVITAIHLNSRRRPPNTRALFRFFDEMEWDRLVNTGGRLGEMADRAGFEAESEAVKAQVMEMRQTTEERLGDEFEKLIGSSHAYEDIDKQIIDRYICYGDPDDEGALGEGVYADITKLADLYIDLPTYPTGLCLRDTPGVNDTFMMREQITLNAISDSRVCVVVLSAHQALSTMDMALLRIICNVQAREVLIFVNRIDTLADPRNETGEIRKSIEKTLKRAGVTDEIEILFGSGYWANRALADKCDEMLPASRAALVNWSDTSEEELADDATMRQAAFDSSGVGELHRAIAKRIVEGPGQVLLDDLAAETDNVLQMVETVNLIAGQKVDRDLIEDLDFDEVAECQKEIRDRALQRFDALADEKRKSISSRLERVRETFVGSALEALESHLKTFGEFDTWTYEAVSLRMMMRTAFLSTCGAVRKKTSVLLEQTLDEYGELLSERLGIMDHASEIELLSPPTPSPPTALARTLSLDLQSTWWRRFWKFGQKTSPASRYESVIRAETAPLIEELMSEHFDVYVQLSKKVLEDFLGEEEKLIETILECVREGEEAEAGTDNDDDDDDDDDDGDKFAQEKVA